MEIAITLAKTAMPKFEMLVKKTEVSYCWITVSTKDQKNGEKKALELAPDHDKKKDFGNKEAVTYSIADCCQITSADSRESK